MVSCAGLEMWGEVSAGEIGLGVWGRQLKFKARRLVEITSRLCGTDKKRDPRTKQGTLTLSYAVEKSKESEKE